MGYLLDSNVFIEAKNHYYGFDFCPAFWDWIDAAYRAERVFSVEKVGEELFDYGDELATWAKERSKTATFFLKPDDAVRDSLVVVAQWANSQTYTPAAINEFLQAADFYLVAHALAHGHVAVTRERLDPNARKKIQIPNACEGVGAQWMDPYAMLRAEKVKFVI